MEENHAIAGRVFRHSLADGNDDTGRFVTIDTRRRKQVVLDLLEIGMTDAAGFHANKQLARPDDRRVDALDSDLAVSGINGCPHGARYWLTRREWRLAPN